MIERKINYKITGEDISSKGVNKFLGILKEHIFYNFGYEEIYEGNTL